MRNTGIIGVLTLLCFGLGFGIFFMILNPGIFSLSDGLLIVGYSSQDLYGLNWMRYFTYIFIGILIITFCIRLIILNRDRGVNLAGKILLLVSGITWTTFGIIRISPESEFDIYFTIFRIVLTLTLSSLGFILIAVDYGKIVRNIKINWFLLSIGVLILVNGILDIFVIHDYPNELGGLSWLLYFIGIGLIGLNVLIKASAQQKI